MTSAVRCAEQKMEKNILHYAIASIANKQVLISQWDSHSDSSQLNFLMR